MIKLTRPPEPQKLAMEKAGLTGQYLADSKKAVWRKDYIIEPLYQSSNKKCAYCESVVTWGTGNHDFYIELDEARQLTITIPNHENNFLHIDHFVARKHDPEKVVEWSNLISCCPKCNYLKGGHNVVDFPIVNPYEDDPRDYYIFSGIFFQVKCSDDKSKMDKANKTITLFCFIDRLWEPVSHLNKAIENTLSTLFSRIDEDLTLRRSGDQSSINTAISSIEKILCQGLPQSPYGSFISSSILRNQYYTSIRAKLVFHQLWSQSLQALEDQLKTIAYE